MEPAVCLTWNDHRWKGRRFLEAGKHPTMGHFHRYVNECEMCGRLVQETEWITLSEALSPYGTTVGTTEERKES